VELIITIIIASVLLTIALPFSRNFMVNYRMNSAASDIVAALQLAKITAVRKNANTVVVFSSSPYSPSGQSGTYRVFVDSDEDWVEDSGEETLVSTVTMPSGVTLYFSSFTNNGTGGTDSAGFSPKGLVARSTTGAFVSGEVRLRNVAGRYARVQVTAAGGITLSKSQDGINWN
jgi:type IV fimbrial biogenesis protein FimT